MRDYKNHCMWIFGEPKVGKTTTAYNLMQKKLRNYILIDGDKFRRSRTPSLDFSREGILKNNQECLRMVRFLISEGWNVVVSMITPFKEMRELIKKELGEDCLRVRLTCNKEVREKRKNFFDSDIIFEEEEYDLLLDTNFLSEEEVIENILKVMQEREIIQ